MDYVIKCHKAELRDTVDAVISHEIPCEEYIKRGWRTFSNAGNCCKDIVDAIEYFTQEPISFQLGRSRLSVQAGNCFPLHPLYYVELNGRLGFREILTT